MKLGLDTLATHLQGGRLAPAYLVSGDEALLVGEAVDALRRSARQQGYTEREVHFPERASDWAQIDPKPSSKSLEEPFSSMPFSRSLRSLTRS